MIVGHSIHEEMRSLGVVTRCKSDSKLMKLIGFFLGREFISRFWTTIPSTKPDVKAIIYYPTCVSNPYIEEYIPVLEHEMTHVRQLDDMGGIDLPDWLWGLLYLVFPVPFYLAWFRWRCEREAYWLQIEKLGSPIERAQAIERVTNVLWFYYGRCWPRSWMTDWFLKRSRMTLYLYRELLK